MTKEGGNSKGRTFDSLVAELDERDRRYEQRFKSQQTAVDAALAAAKAATEAALLAAKELGDKAEQFADEKLASHNTIWPRVEQLVKIAEDKIRLVEVRVSRFEDRGFGLTMGWKILMGLVLLVAAIASIYAIVHK